MDDEITTLTLQFDPPIEFNGKAVADVTLREPTVSEYVDASTHAGYGLTRALLMSVGKMSPGHAAKVPIGKAIEADMFFARFMRPGEETKAEQPKGPQSGDVELFASMELREPTVEELVTAGPGLLGTAKLVSLVTGIPYDVALRMPASRLTAADEFFAGFVSPSPQTTRS